MVLDYSDKLRNSSHLINRLRRSDLVEGQIDTTNIDKLSRSGDNGSLGDGRKLKIWYNLAGKTL